MEFSSNQPQKGMLDEFPWDLARTRFVEGKIKTILESFHYLEYDAPVLEDIEIFSKKSGDELVREQAYTLTDKGQRELVLRPEMTPSLARMISQIAREKPRPYRWYSIPKCYRYERPQKGRLREFRQLNVDLMGDESIYSDFEMCRLVVKIMRAFGVPDAAFQIRFNHREVLNALLEKQNFSPEKQKWFYRMADRRDKLPKEVFDQEAAKGLSETEAAFLNQYLEGGETFVN
ncbi:MAG: ATP phosphoribosyltransferase regulatory subunit, partial [Spirochaetia bacterium]|nr:ATP phosphoribosyltransferase regulatory subunit [Spirochaetia bacterium]